MRIPDAHFCGHVATIKKKKKEKHQNCHKKLYSGLEYNRN